MLLILTSDQDLAADYLIVDLLDRQLPYFRLNSEELAQAHFEFRLDQRDSTRRIFVEPNTLDLQSITAVWYRRSIHPVPDNTLAPAMQRFISGELRHLAMGLVWNPSITWVNPIDKVFIAEHKLYQLQLAAALGFLVPRTFVSSDINELRKFASDNPLGTIYKPIFHGMFFDGMNQHSVYTRRLDCEMLDASSLRLCPVLVQEEIPRTADVRVTIVGQQCFVANIQGGAAIVDWRNPSEHVRYSVGSLEDEAIVLCRQMLRDLGLLYGAFDFIRSPSGELTFLELNPTGEWAWLEEELDFPIRDAFVELFFGDGS